MTFSFFAHHVLPWFCSTFTILMTYMQGRVWSSAWLVGLGNQLLWFAFTLGTQTWGLLPLNIVLTYLYVRNYFKWQNITEIRRARKAPWYML